MASLGKATGVGIAAGTISLGAFSFGLSNREREFDSGLSELVAPSNEHGAFVSSFDTIPDHWSGKVFELSDEYPRTHQVEDSLPWYRFDPKQKPYDYLRAVMNYALEGNLEADFQVNKNEVRTWYHTPGLAYGEGGREFARGLTRERSSRPFELAPTQGTTFQNWGVGFYNPAGGFTIGQVWQDRDNPDPSKAQFPEGTVSIKLLFTEATLEEVPFLEGSIEWEVNIWENLENPARSARKLRLLQVDLAVKDSRLNDSTGWAFGTLVYDNSIEANDPWQRLRPVGLMWGNDPGVTPEDILANRDVIRESWINPAAKVEHLGWAGRLNGPVDNPISSCLSCHSTALVGAQVSMVPSRSGTDQERLQWFRNLKGDESFSGEGTPTDYSLQLSMGIMNYLQSLKANEASTNGPQKK